MLRSLTTLNPSEVSVAVALRNTLGMLLPLIAGALSGHVAAGVAMAVGALNAMLSDLPGPYRLRIQRIGLTAAGAAVSVSVGHTLGGNDATAIGAVLAWGFAGGLLSTCDRRWPTCWMRIAATSWPC